VCVYSVPGKLDLAFINPSPCFIFSFRMADRKQPFQNIEELQRFMLHGVCPTGIELGRGSFGCVKELKMNGKLYAGKQIHEELLNPDNKGVHAIRRKYSLECKVCDPQN